MPTTHAEPTYEVDGVIHYCVANMPGAVPVTSTHALNNVTLPLRAADRRSGAGRGDARPTRTSPRASTSTTGRVTYPAVAEELGYDLLPLEQALA